MRKEAGFEVTDYINIGYQTNSQDLQKVLKQNFESIKRDVLARGLFDNIIDGYTKDWDINGQKIVLSVQKI